MKAKNNNKKSLFNIIYVLLFLLLPVISLAGDPPDPGGGPDSVPIDGGASLLVVIAGIYGAQKLKDKTTADREN